MKKYGTPRNSTPNPTSPSYNQVGMLPHPQPRIRKKKKIESEFRLNKQKQPDDSKASSCGC